MATASPVETVLGTGGRIGRYFSIVGALPSALFVLYFAALIWGGAWAGRFSPAQAVATARGLGWQDVVWLVAIAILVAVVVHPLQFTLTQILEGYWGAGPVARHLTAAAAGRHRRRAAALDHLAQDARRRWRKVVELLDEDDRRTVAEQPADAQDDELRQLLNRADATPWVTAYLTDEAAERARRAYPRDLRRVLPTRLGNSLRRYEDAVGVQYGLSAIAIAPHLSLVAEPAHYQYVVDERQQMDLAIRMCLLGLLSTAATAVLLADNGPWVLLSFAAYLVAYTSYRGAVSAARSYGVAVATVLDLNRFRLYEQLHLTMPRNSTTEYAAGRRLTRLLAGEHPTDRDLRVTYRHPSRAAQREPAE